MCDLYKYGIENNYKKKRQNIWQIKSNRINLPTEINKNNKIMMMTTYFWWWQNSRFKRS